MCLNNPESPSSHPISFDECCSHIQDLRSFSLLQSIDKQIVKEKVSEICFFIESQTQHSSERISIISELRSLYKELFEKNDVNARTILLFLPSIHEASSVHDLKIKPTNDQARSPQGW